MTRDTILLRDGFNGHTAKFYAEPLERDGPLVKLQCAEPGKEHMFAWKHGSFLPIQCPNCNEPIWDIAWLRKEDGKTCWKCGLDLRKHREQIAREKEGKQ